MWNIFILILLSEHMVGGGNVARNQKRPATDGVVAYFNSTHELVLLGISNLNKTKDNSLNSARQIDQNCNSTKRKLNKITQKKPFDGNESSDESGNASSNPNPMRKTFTNITTDLSLFNVFNKPADIIERPPSTLSPRESSGGGEDIKASANEIIFAVLKAGHVNDWHNEPEKLVIDDCNEQKVELKERNTEFNVAQDMEAYNKEKIVDRKARDSSSKLRPTKSFSQIEDRGNSKIMLFKNSSVMILASGKEYEEINKNKIARAKRIAKRRLKIENQKISDEIHNYSDSTSNAAFERADNLTHSKNTVPLNFTNQWPLHSVKDAKKVTFELDNVTKFIDENIGKSHKVQSAWSDRSREKNGIKFAGPPPRERYFTSAFRISDVPFLFEFVSDFFSFIYPFDFPIELVRDVMWRELSVPQLLLESLKVEASFLAVIILFVSLALMIPSYLLCLLVLHLVKNDKLYETENVTQGRYVPDDSDLSCQRRSYVIGVISLVLLGGISAAGMVWSGERARASGAAARPLAVAAAQDIITLVESAATDLEHAFALPADMVVATSTEYLNNVDVLLGEPIQKALAAETGIDVTLDSLNDIITMTEDISYKVDQLHETSLRAVELARQSRERLRDLQRQVENFRKHCGPKDAPLCDTVNHHGIELRMEFDTLLQESKLPTLKGLGRENLTLAAASARTNFNHIPKSVAQQTKPVMEDILKALEGRRTRAHWLARAWRGAARRAAAAVRGGRSRLVAALTALETHELWRVVLMMGAVVLTIFVLILIICALTCGSCKEAKHTRRTLHVSTCLIFAFSLCLWNLVILLFVVGGHAEVFICRPLYDYPDYKVLSILLDKPGLMYEEGSGLFEDIFKELPNITIDIPVKEVLRECEHNRPSYSVFRLDRILDVNKETAYFHWEELTLELKRLVVEVNGLNISTPNIQTTLHEMMEMSKVNLSYYRAHLNGPLTGKDLNSLAEQLENVANQIADLSTSSRIETLASRTRRLVATTLQSLSHLKTELVYKLTELELQIQPFQRRINVTLGHLKTIQYYIDNEGGVIADQRVHEYLVRLLSYLEQYRGYALDAATSWAAPCRPLWDTFHATRTLLCRGYVDALNGFWFSTFLMLTLWIILTPLIITLGKICKDTAVNGEEALLGNIITVNGQSTGSLEEGATWSTPGAPPPQNGNW